MADEKNLDAIEVMKESWEIFKTDLPLYVIAGLIVVIVGSVTLGILMGPLMVGFIQLINKRRKGEEASAGDVFGAMGSLVSSLIAGLILAILISIGFALCVLPGLIVMIFAIFTLQIIAYQDAGPIDAIKGSFGLVKSAFVPVIVLLIFVGIVNAIGNIVVVGGLLTFPFTIIALNLSYEKLTAAS